MTKIHVLAVLIPSMLSLAVAAPARADNQAPRTDLGVQTVATSGMTTMKCDPNGSNTEGPSRVDTRGLNGQAKSANSSAYQDLIRFTNSTPAQ